MMKENVFSCENDICAISTMSGLYIQLEKDSVERLLITKIVGMLLKGIAILEIVSGEL